MRETLNYHFQSDTTEFQHGMEIYNGDIQLQ